VINKFVIYISIVKKNCRQVYLFQCCHTLMQVEKILKNTETDVINELKRSGLKWVRLNFCDPFGFLHQISVNSTFKQNKILEEK
jgi:hypothetical protein